MAQLNARQDKGVIQTYSPTQSDTGHGKMYCALGMTFTKYRTPVIFYLIGPVHQILWVLDGCLGLSSVQCISLCQMSDQVGKYTWTTFLIVKIFITKINHTVFPSKTADEWL